MKRNGLLVVIVVLAALLCVAVAEEKLATCNMCQKIAKDILDSGVCTSKDVDKRKTAFDRFKYASGDFNDAVEKVFEDTTTHCPDGEEEQYDQDHEDAEHEVFNTLCTPDFGISLKSWQKWDLRKDISKEDLPEACCSSRSCIGRQTPLCKASKELTIDPCSGQIPRREILAKIDRTKPIQDQFEQLFTEFREYGKKCRWRYGGRDCYTDLLEARSNGVQCGPLSRAMRALALEGLKAKEEDIMLYRYKNLFLVRNWDDIVKETDVKASWRYKGNVVEVNDGGGYTFSGQSLFTKHVVLFAYGHIYDSAIGVVWRDVYDPKEGAPSEEKATEIFEKRYVDTRCERYDDRLVEAHEFERGLVEATAKCGDKTLTDNFKEEPEEWKLPYGLKYVPMLFDGYTFEGCVYLSKVHALRCNGWYTWMELDDVEVVKSGVKEKPDTK